MFWFRSVQNKLNENSLNVIRTPQRTVEQAMRWAALVLILWSPHILLDYTYYIYGVIRPVPHGGVIFFFTTLCSGMLLARWTWPVARSIASLRWLQVCLTIFLAGVLFSAKDLHSLRLVAIIGTVSLSMAFAAIWVSSLKRRQQWIALLVIFTPFWASNALGILLEVFELFELKLPIDHTKQAYFFTARWHTLHSSANGFGLDAAVTSISGLCGIVMAKRPLSKLCFLAILLIGLVCVFFSGTRAAMLFVIVGAVMALLSNLGTRSLIRVGLAVLACVLVGGSLVGVDTIFGYLRISGDVQLITSNRLAGLTNALEQVHRSSFFGAGFGAADGPTQIHPTNMFYPFMVFEIGLVGAAGLFVAMIYPLTMVLWRQFSPSKVQRAPADLLQQFASPMLVGLLVWLLFEFDVVRVSATNQFFMFFWTIILLRLMGLWHSLESETGKE